MISCQAQRVLCFSRCDLRPSPAKRSSRPGYASLGDFCQHFGYRRHPTSGSSSPGNPGSSALPFALLRRAVHPVGFVPDDASAGLSAEARKLERSGRHAPTFRWLVSPDARGTLLVVVHMWLWFVAEDVSTKSPIAEP